MVGGSNLPPTIQASAKFRDFVGLCLRRRGHGAIYVVKLSARRLTSTERNPFLCYFECYRGIISQLKGSFCFNLLAFSVCFVGLSHICGKPVRRATLLSVKNLQSSDSRSVKVNVQ